MKKVMIIGRGAREHSLGLRVRQCEGVGEMLFAPGNAGTEGIGRNVPTSDVSDLVALAEQERVDFTIVGPEAPLAEGVVDRFRDAGLRIFGPTKAAAQIEWSKSFARSVMDSAGIPAPVYGCFEPVEGGEEGEVGRDDDYASACFWILHNGTERHRPVVIKLDGLASGKGVFIERGDAAYDLLRRFLDEERKTIVLEEYLEGEELSVHALCHGTEYLLLPVAEDHKPIGDGDIGPMTGGMGAVAPVPWVSEREARRLGETVIAPVLGDLARHGTPFVGALFAGVIMTDEGPKVLEYNARFGDPEAEVILPLIGGDFLGLLEAVADGDMDRARRLYEPLPRHAAAVVIASREYPKPSRERVSVGGTQLLTSERALLHAGTVLEGGVLFTDGGRVFAATGVSDGDLEEALARAYETARAIRFDGMQYRRDIGRKALARAKG